MAKELIKAQSLNPHIKDFDEYKQLYDESINNPQGFFKKIGIFVLISFTLLFIETIKLFK